MWSVGLSASQSVRQSFGQAVSQSVSQSGCLFNFLQIFHFKIDRLRIGHDSKGDGKGIFVEEVEVAPAEGERAIFPCYCWLAEGKGDKKMERDILPGQPRPPRPSEC